MLQCFFGTTWVVDDFAIRGHGAEQLVEAHPPAANLHGPLVADFVSTIVDDREPRVTGEEGRRTNVVMERAYRAAGRGEHQPTALKES